MDPEFEPLHSVLQEIHILLDATSQVDHVPEAEFIVRSTEDSSKTAFTRTLFKNLPDILNISFIMANAFWLNGIASEDSVSKELFPDMIITGLSLIYWKHCCIPYGQYAHTHEEGNNTIEKERTLGAIVMHPIGYAKVTHAFLNINTGKFITPTSWDALPMTNNIVDQFHQITRDQPSSVDFRDWKIR